MNRTRYLIQNTVLFAIGNIGSKLIGFLMLPLYTHYLSVSEYGTIDIILTVSLILSPLIIGNIHEAVMRYLLDKDSEKDRIVTSALIMFVFASLISLVIMLFLTIYNYNRFLWIIPLFIFTSAIYPVPLSYIRGIEDNKLFVKLNILYTFLVSTLNILFLVYFKLGINGYFISLTLSNLIIIIIAIIFSKMYIYFLKFNFDKKTFFSMLKYSMFLIPNSLLWWVTNSSDRVMITSYLGIEQNGLYSIAYRLPTVLSILATIFMQSWQLTAIKEKEANDVWKYSNEIFNNLLKTLFLCGSILLLFLKPIINIFLAESYYTSWEYSPLLILALIFGALGGFIGVSYTVAKDSKGMMLSALSGAIINIILNLILIPKYGVNGASFATCISFLIVLIYRQITTRKYLEIIILKPSYIFILLIFLLQLFAVYLDGILSYVYMSVCVIAISIISYNEIKQVVNMVLKRAILLKRK